MKTSALEASSAAAGKASIAVSGTTAAISFVSHEFMFGMIGLLFTLLTFMANLYYKRKADARATREAIQREQERALRMEIMRKDKCIIAPTSALPTTLGDE
mgnify:CR=1 FL=1